ncbi:MAG TPA: glycosyltransferase [Candidatus Saccharimonadales bacterium]|nr:glycosyltransferase [Candidatus Saccharimonadales bacterium]
MKKTSNQKAKNKEKFLSISVVMPTFNSSRTIDRSLKSVRDQDYPQEKIEILTADGGSTDNTLEIVKKYNAKIIKIPKKLQNAEYNKGVAVNKAKNDIILLLDHDNILPHKKWLRKMIIPFLENKDLVASEPLRFHYDKKMTVLDRYFALLGGVDPVAYYFGKDSHLSWAFDTYNLFGKSRDMGDYYLVTFTPDKIPALGGNGAAVRRKLLLKEAHADPAHFFHIDVHVDLIKKGFNTYGFFKDSIIHLTNNKLVPFLLRRKYYIEKYHFEDLSKRRYSVYEPKKDRLNLIKYVIFSITIVKPLYDAIRGFIKKPDIAWFIHPFMCLAMLLMYGIPTIKEEVRRVIKK